MEKPEENIIEEAKNPAKKIKGMGVDMSPSVELDNLKGGLDSLSNLISHDSPITGKKMEILNDSLQGIKINIGGQVMTVEEAEKIPDLKENLKIWREILAGKFKNLGMDDLKLTFLIPEVAEALCKYTGDRIDLPHVKTISDEVAEKLSKCKSTLFLRGLTTLSDESARYFGKYKGGHLIFSRLYELSDKATEYLCEYRGGLQFQGRTIFSDKALGYLSKQHQSNSMHLYGVTSLSDEGAKNLAEHEGEILDLPGLATITDTAAELLSKRRGRLWLNGLTSLTDQVAERLSHHIGKDLCLDGLTSISDVAAEHLSKHRGDLSFTKLTTFSDKAAKFLSQHPHVFISDDKVKARLK